MVKNIMKPLETKCFNFEKPHVNSTFGKVKIQVASYEQVANGMQFTKESMEKAMNSLNYIPIIGAYSKEDDDYTDHGQSIEITSDGMEFKKNTKPIGVVIKDSGKFEKVKAKNGEEITYVTCEGYVWLQECPEAETLFKGDDNAQSMEINLISYEPNEGFTYRVNEFEYTALCALAKDGSVPPAFHEAKILTNFESNEFKAQYSQMMSALDKYMKKYEEKEDDIVENEEQVVDTQEEVEVKVENEVDETTDTEETEEVTNVDDVEDETQQEKQEETTEQMSEDEASQQDVDYKSLYEDSINTIKTMQENIDTLQSKVDEFTLKEERNEKFSMIDAYKGKIQDDKFANFKDKVDKYSKETLKTELLSSYVEALESKASFTQEESKTIPTVETFSDVTGDDLPESVKLIKKYTKKQ